VGTGLGLWVSKGIVEKHQGRLDVVSSQAAEDHGTAFVMTLPRRGALRLSA
jgi:signal transduction histidine kinase